MPFDPFALLTNPGMGDASALPMPGDAVSVPAPMPSQVQPIPPQFPVPMQASDLPPAPDTVPMKDRGGIDWLALMKLAAPAIGMLVSRGNGGEGAFMNGWLQGQQLASTESLRKQGEEQKRRTASADYLMKIGESALAIDDPVLFDEFMRLADDAGAQAGYNRPGELRGRLSYPQSKVAALRLKELTDRLDLLEKQGYNLDDLAQSGSSIELKDGKHVPVASALELTHRRPVDAAGQPVAKPTPVAKPDNRDLTESQYDDLVALWQMQNPGKAVPPEVRRQLRIQAKKEIGQADDRPPAVRVALSGMNALYEANDPQVVADAIIRGERSPETGDLGRGMVGAVDSILAKRGFNKARAVSEWKAVQRFYTSKQSTQQLRIRQSADVILQSMDEVDALASEWKAGGFKALNRATLEAAKQGLMGPKAASIATRLDAQITESVEAMANVYMGGNSPTERAMMLAEKQLRGDWSEKVLKDATALVRKNTQFRLNAIDSIGPSGVSPQSPYVLPKQEPPKTAAPAGMPSYQDYLRAKGRKP